MAEVEISRHNSNNNISRVVIEAAIRSRVEGKNSTLTMVSNINNNSSNRADIREILSKHQLLLDRLLVAETLVEEALDQVVLVVDELLINRIRLRLPLLKRMISDIDRNIGVAAMQQQLQQLENNNKNKNNSKKSRRQHRLQMINRVKLFKQLSNKLNHNHNLNSNRVVKASLNKGLNNNNRRGLINNPETIARIITTAMKTTQIAEERTRQKRRLCNNTYTE